MSLKNNDILKLARNKYVLALVVFAVWITFFDQDDYFSRQKVRHQIEELEDKRAFYKEEVIRLKHKKEQLENDPDVLEKYARENFFMARPGEDVYLLVDPE